MATRWCYFAIQSPHYLHYATSRPAICDAIISQLICDINFVYVKCLRGICFGAYPRDSNCKRSGGLFIKVQSDQLRIWADKNLFAIIVCVVRTGNFWVVARRVRRLTGGWSIDAIWRLGQQRSWSGLGTFRWSPKRLYSSTTFRPVIPGYDLRWSHLAGFSRKNEREGIKAEAIRVYHSEYRPSITRSSFYTCGNRNWCCSRATSRRRKDLQMLDIDRGGDASVPNRVCESTKYELLSAFPGTKMSNRR